MTRRMLINAQTPEELRLAIVTDSTLDTYQVEAAEGGLTRGNIYRGVIANIQPSLNAAFIDYGAERNGFLAIQDVVPEAWYHQPKKGSRPKIEDILDKGKPIVVQVTREPEGKKGAALTTNLSLAGRYLVLTPFDDTRGISRKVEDEDSRKRLKKLAKDLEVPKGCGVIVRTNAIDQTKTTLSRDLKALLRLWKQVSQGARQGKSAKLLYSDQDLILQALRDYLDSSVEEILVDSDAAYEKAEEYLAAFMPRGKTRLIRYSERTPLFSKFNLEPQIDRIYDRRVELSSGGSIVIDRTEALTAIDVNSGRSTKAKSQEETAVHTNLEAADEVARQLRLRDIGGLVVVDFIDMRSQSSRRKVEKALRDAMKADKARSRVGRISANGLLEINRQRIHQALSLRTHRTCPTCDGTGRIASPEMVGLALLRRVEARAATGTLQRVRVGLHPELADAIQNARRHEISSLEREFDIDVEVVAAPHLHRTDQEVDWFSRPKGSQRSEAASPPAEPSVKVADVTTEPVEEPMPTRRRRRGKKEEAPEDERRKRKAAGRKPETKDEQEETKEKPSSRRRRRRRRSKKAAEKAGASEGGTQRGREQREQKEKAASGQAKEPAEDAKTQSGSGSDQETSGRRRRRRRRKSSSGAQGETASGGKAADESSEKKTKGKQKETKPAEAEDSGGTNRRRRRRRRRKADA